MSLSHLDPFERVAYRRSSESYLPGDTIPRRYLRYYVEQRNRADTTLRHSYLSYYNADDTTRIDGGYDGTIAVDLDHDRREVVIDDFSIPRAPYRLTDMTFFCRAEAILRDDAGRLPQSAAVVRAYCARRPEELLQVLAPMERLKREQLRPILTQWQALLVSALTSRSGLQPLRPECAQIAEARPVSDITQAIEAIRLALRDLEGNVSPGAI